MAYLDLLCALFNKIFKQSTALCCFYIIFINTVTTVYERNCMPKKQPTAIIYFSCLMLCWKISETVTVLAVLLFKTKTKIKRNLELVNIILKKTTSFPNIVFYFCGDKSLCEVLYLTFLIFQTYNCIGVYDLCMLKY